MCAGPRFHDGRTLLLGISLGILAYLIRPSSSLLGPRLKPLVAMASPPLVLLCWFVLQRELLFTDRIGQVFYRTTYGDTAWRFNSAILIAFGIAFSFRLFRSSDKRERNYGTICMLAFLPLLLGFKSIGPVGETSSLAYKWDRRVRPAVSEPLSGGKTLSYWASRVSGLAEESEPALESIRAMGPEGVRALIQEFRTGEGAWDKGEERPQSWSVRQHAAEALIRLGPDAQLAVPLMIESLRSSDRAIREQAAAVLGRTGDSSASVVNALIRALEDEDSAYHATKSLARLSEKDPAIIRQLAATAKGSRPKAAYWATVALAEVENVSTIVLPELIECVQRAPKDQRQPAVQAIALCGTNAGSAVPVLIVALKSSEEWTRKCIYIALGRIGPAASNAIPTLRAALTNETYLPARADIARALWRIDSNQIELVSAAVRQCLNERSEVQRNGGVTYDFLSALDLIGEMGPRATRFDADVRRNLDSQDLNIQFNAAWALLRISPDRATPARATLRRLTGLDEYPLEHIGSDEWGKGLSELKRQRESFHLRMAAAGALWQSSEDLKTPLTALISDLVRDWDYFTSMKHPVPETRAAVPALVAIVQDPSRARVHSAAREALRAINGSDGERW